MRRVHVAVLYVPVEDSDTRPYPLLLTPPKPLRDGTLRYPGPAHIHAIRVMIQYIVHLEHIKRAIEIIQTPWITALGKTGHVGPQQPQR